MAAGRFAFARARRIRQVLGLSIHPPERRLPPGGIRD